MAVFKQIRKEGGFRENESILSGKQLVKLGISIGLKDFMKFPGLKDSHGVVHNSGVILKINDNLIEIGKTFIYEPGDFLTVNSLSFPKGAPSSTLVDIVYKIPTD